HPERLRRAEEQRIAVGLRPGGDLRTERAAAARPVLDDDLLPKALAHEHREHAAERIGRSPGRERNNHPDWPLGIALPFRGKRAQGEKYEKQLPRHCAASE